MKICLFRYKYLAENTSNWGFWRPCWCVDRDLLLRNRTKDCLPALLLICGIEQLVDEAGHWSLLFKRICEKPWSKKTQCSSQSSAGKNFSTSVTCHIPFKKKLCSRHAINCSTQRTNSHRWSSLKPGISPSM